MDPGCFWVARSSGGCPGGAGGGRGVLDTLLVPTVNLGSSNQNPMDTIGITTIHRFSIAPTFNLGQNELYKITPLIGIASFIPF